MKTFKKKGKKMLRESKKSEAGRDKLESLKFVSIRL